MDLTGVTGGLLWPLRFDNPSAAVSFADGFLSRPDCKSQLGTIRKRAIEKASSPAFDQWGMRVTQDRLRDLAETISVCLASVRNPPGRLYRYVYGCCDSGLEISGQAAHLAWTGPGTGVVAKRKTIAKCDLLVRLLMIERQRLARYNVRTPAHLIASALGMTRQQYYEQWGAEVHSIRGTLSDWISEAERAMIGELETRRIL